jgi:hypothetical protein
MFRTTKAPGGAKGPDPLPRAALRDCIVRSAVRLHHLATLAEMDVGDDELERAAQHLVSGLAELRPRLAQLKRAAG